MKLRIIYFLWAICLLAGCADEKIPVGNSAQEGDITLDVSLDDFGLSTMGSRALASDETSVKSITIWVFDKDGKLLVNQDLTPGNYGTVAAGADGSNTVGGIIRARYVLQRSEYAKYTGTPFPLKFYAIANYKGNDNVGWTFRTNSKTTPTNVANLPSNLTVNDFETMKLEREMNLVGDGSIAARLKNDITQRPDAYLLMTAGGTIVDATKRKINFDMKRVDTRLDVVVKAGTGVTLDLKKYRLNNLPVGIKPFVTESTSSTVGTDYVKYGAGTDAEDLGWQSFEDRWTSGEDKVLTLYMPENKQTAKQTITDALAKADLNISGTPTYWQKYKLRSRQNKNTDGTNLPTFKYAPDNGTYFEFVANVTHNNGATSSTDFTEDARFRVFLGASVAMDADYTTANVNDYNAERNVHYTYTITVNGLNDVIVEVERHTPSKKPDAENNTAIDAAVTRAYGLVQLDSHFDQKLLVLNYNDMASRLYQEDTGWIFDQPGRGMGFVFSDPYGEVVNVDDTKLKDTERYNWVKFYVHPGTLIGKRGFRMNIDDQYMRENGIDAQLMTPHQLMNYIRDALKDIKEKGGTDEVKKKWGCDPSTGDFVISTVVNEYYYTKAPDGVPAPSINYMDMKNWVRRSITLDDQDKWDRNGWRTFVNQPDRTLGIYFKGYPRQKSKDQASSYLEAEVVVRQRSINALYDFENLPLNYYGFGYESTDDDEWRDNPDAAPNSDQQRMAQCHEYIKSESDIKEYANNQNGYDIFDGETLYRRLLPGGDWFINQRWKDFIPVFPNLYETDTNPEDHKGWAYQFIDYKPRKGFAGYTALSRNRDVNRDGYIQASEVKWYIPSLPQMEAIGLAQRALPVTQRLKTDNVAYYLTSTSNRLYDGGYGELLVYNPLWNTTHRQTIPTANRGIYGWPNANDGSDVPFYYGYFDTQRWGGDTKSVKPLRVLAVRNLGKRPANVDRYAQRFSTLQGSFRGWNYNTDIDGSRGSWTNLIIDCSTLPQLARRKIYIANGPLPKHDVSSEYAKPYTAFRVAKASIQAQRLRSWGVWGANSNADGYDQRVITQNTNGEYKEIEGYFDNDYRYSWAPRMYNDNDPTHPCRNYAEYSYDDYGNKVKVTGWRLPNAGELQLMIRYFPPQFYLDLMTFSHHYSDIVEEHGWAKNTVVNWRNTNNPLIGIDELRSNWYQGAYVMSKTTYQKDGKTLHYYAGDFWAGTYGFRVHAMTEQWKYTRFDVRCVKDLSDAEINDLHSNQNVAGTGVTYVGPVRYWGDMYSARAKTPSGI